MTSEISGSAGDTINISQDIINNVFNYENITTHASGTFIFDATNGGCKITNTTPIDYLTIKFTSDITFNSNTQYFIINSNYITIDGDNKTVNINVFGYAGLIKYGSNAGQKINVNNIHVNGTSGSLATKGGWIGQSNFLFGNFTNCHSDGNIGDGNIGDGNNRGCGGIFGEGAGSNNGQATAINCYSTGDIIIISGGIFGEGAGSNNGTASATNCYSTGNITNSSGGIFGGYAGSNNGQATATNCYSTGDLYGSSGGIFGGYAGSNNGQATATNCYSTGDITTNSGGIFGASAGINYGQATATKCMYNGDFNKTSPRYGQLAGGNSQNITVTNIVGYLNNPNNIIGIKDNIINIGYENNQIYYNINSELKKYITDLTQPINIINNTKNNFGPLNINIITYIPINNKNLYFNITDWVNIDGKNNIFKINNMASPYDGLIQYFASYNANNININNIHVDGTNSTLSSGGGWIGQQGFNYGTFNNCHSDGPIGDSNNYGCGGIVGAYAGFNNSFIKIINCYSTGDIGTNNSGDGSGGIVGANTTIVEIINCYSTGDIGKNTTSNGQGSGGIFGSQNINGYDNNIAIQLVANYCYSMGSINNSANSKSGGIFGANVGANKKEGQQYYAYSIKSAYNGIFNSEDINRFGQLAGSNSKLTQQENTLGYLNNPNNIIGVAGDNINIGYDNNQIYYNINSVSNNYITDLNQPLNIINNTKNNFGPLNINIITDIPINNSQLYFNLATDWINIDGGKNNTFTINNIARPYDGLIQFIAGQNINVNNIHVDGTTSTLSIGGGWIGQKGFLYGNFNNCHSDGNIGDNENSGCGGIFGSSAGISYGQATATNCYSTGNITTNSGGIFGGFAGDNGQATATYCYSTGDITTNSGGIFSIGAGSNYGQATATNCYSTGSIAIDSGGIFGSYAGINNGKATATNCYSTGNITTSSGGIFGYGAGFNKGQATANNCYSTGNITTNSGGIFGGSAGINNGKATATNCYSTGDITTNSGGIFGDGAGYFYGQATATKCMYNGIFNTTPSRYGQLAGYNSIITSATNILGYGGLL